MFCFFIKEEDVAEKTKDEISQLLEAHGLMKSGEARSEVPQDEEPDDEPDEPDEPWESEEDTEEPYGDEEEHTEL